MAAPSARQSELLATERWSWLGPFLHTWHADPLDASHGASPTQLAQAEQRIGRALPSVVREWFELVSHRLMDVQDSPCTVATTYADDDDDAVAVWLENQGVWELRVDADNVATLDDPEFEFAPTPAVVALQAMVISDTIVGAWSGSNIGPLGPLSGQVRGGFIEDVSIDLVDACRQRYPSLGIPGTPFMIASPRGDGATLLRGDQDWGLGLEWATASEAAFAAFDGIADLEPPGGQYQVRLVLEPLTDAERADLSASHGGPDLSRFDAGPGRITEGSLQGVRLEMLASTTDPQATATALLASVPGDLQRVAATASRPVRLASWRPLASPASMDAGSQDSTQPAC